MVDSGTFSSCKKINVSSIDWNFFAFLLSSLSAWEPWSWASYHLILSWVCWLTLDDSGDQMDGLQIGDLLVGNPAPEPMEGAVAAHSERPVRQATRRRGKGQLSALAFFFCIGTFMLGVGKQMRNSVLVRIVPICSYCWKPCLVTEQARMSRWLLLVND